MCTRNKQKYSLKKTNEDQVIYMYKTHNNMSLIV